MAVRSPTITADVVDPIQVLRSLRAVRRYAARPISDAVLHDILEVARWTGSSKNTQPWDIVVVRDRNALAELSTAGQFAGHLAGAAAALVLVMEDGNRRFDEGRLAQSLMLAAWSHGVGSCIGSVFPESNKRRVRQLLAIPDGRWVHVSIALGYPADDDALRTSRELRRGHTNVPVPMGRRALDDFVKWERYSG
jgi:nitroreductase